MQDFQAEGSNVLSYDHEHHLEMVQRGRYVYICDVTAAELFVSQHCGYALTEIDVYPFPYSVALQKNSAYVKDVTQM